MAFATTNVKSASIGGALKLTTGDWTGSLGDAAGTVLVAGGKVYSASFLTNLSTGPVAIACQTSPSGTSGVVTLTVNNVDVVTAGTFAVIHA